MTKEENVKVLCLQHFIRLLHSFQKGPNIRVNVDIMIIIIICSSIRYLFFIFGAGGQLEGILY